MNKQVISPEVIKEFKDWLEDYTEDGEFWRPDTAPEMLAYIQELIDSGITLNRAFQIIFGMYDTVSGEYGN